MEKSISNLLKESSGSEKMGNLCLAGGVALNCRMNYKLKNRFNPTGMFIQPAAHDAGTAVGAALYVYSYLTGERRESKQEHALLGPEYGDDSILQVIKHFSFPFKRSSDIAKETAALIASGKIVCWAQGRLEFSPRALGSRSVLADPRDPTVKRRLNKIKGRQPWRPFGPSILAGREGDFLGGAFHSPFMLFTFPVLEDKKGVVPAVVHADGTTRPQSMVRESNELYYKMIEHFDALTGVPMVVNTSFNIANEPIVCTPEDAVASFLMMGADYLAIGNYLISREEIDRKTARAIAGRKEQADPRKKEGVSVTEKKLEYGRFFLRLTTRCNNNCVHCSILDVPPLPARTEEEAMIEIRKGFEAGCRELVFMRGEVTIRRDLLRLVRYAKKLGYEVVKIQTNGRALCYEKYVDRLIEAGATDFEVSVYGSNAEEHDSISRSEGSFKQTHDGLAILTGRDVCLLVTVPVITQNMSKLMDIVELLDQVGVKRLQFNFPRPLRLNDVWILGHIPRLSIASHYIREALAAAAARGMSASTEAAPLCHIPKEFHSIPDAEEDFARFMVSDLHISHDSFASYREKARAEGQECKSCIHRTRCPFVWSSYVELFGTKEYIPVFGDSGVFEERWCNS